MQGQGTVSVPLWYRQERQTQNIIMRLSSFKELEFYINNPDEYIRHQAIFRLGQLKLKESVGALMKIVNDPLESRINRELAAWVLKSSGFVGSNDIFIENQYLDKFSGDERLKDFYLPRFYDNKKGMDYRFDESGIRYMLIDDSIFMRADSVEKMLELQFSFREWIVSYFSLMIKNIKKNIKNLRLKPSAVNPVKSPEKIWDKDESGPSQQSSAVHAVQSPKKIGNEIDASPNEQPSAIHPVQAQEEIWQNIFSLKRSMQKNDEKIRQPKKYKRKSRIYVRSASKASFGSLIKSFFRKLFKVIVFPFVVLWNRKVVFAIALVCLYLFFSFVPYGRMIFYKKSPDLAGFNDHLIKSAGMWIDDQVSYIREKAMEYQLVRDIQKQLAAARTKEEAGTGNDKYIVTAQKLNLRKEPGTSGEKLMLLTKSTVVEYLNRSSQEDDGIWLNIMAPDGTVGWSHSAWLSKMEVGIEAYEGK